MVDPGDPTHIVVRTTFGMLVSRDAGQAFDWICESGAGYGGGVDPGIAVTGSGAILAGIFAGLDVGRGDACTFELAGGPLAGLPVVDVSVMRGAPSRAVALAIGATGNIVSRSDDDALTWTATDAPLPPDFQALTIDVAPSDAQRLYVSGFHKGTFAGQLARSADGGATWEILDIAAAGTRAPYLSAVDPGDADRVYVRLDGTPGTLLVSGDGGGTWSTAFTLPGYMQAFALSPDGAAVLAGGPTDGVWRAPAATLAFQRVEAAGVQCLSWSGTNVYACGVDFAVGRSTDAGDNFTALLRLPCIRGPLACDTATPVGSLCPAEWPDLMVKIGSMYCAGYDAGTGSGAGGAGAAGGGGAATGGSGGGGAAPGGCGCGVAEGAPGWSGVALLALACGVTRRTAARRPRRLKPPRALDLV